MYENGFYENGTVVFFNIRESARGVKDRGILMERFLDHLSENVHLASLNNQSRGILARKVFNSSGKEVTDVLELSYDQEIWLSHGEKFIDPFGRLACGVKPCTRLSTA